MHTFIILNHDIYTLDDAAEIAHARAHMADAGIASLPMYRGEAGDEGELTGEILLVAPTLSGQAPARPVCQVDLVGIDGNAFTIIGACTKAARSAGWTRADINAFRDEALSGDYDQVLGAAMKWFDVR